MPSARDAFFQRIYEHTRQGADVVVVSADLGAPSLDKFRQDFGDRFINVGIAEQNLVSVAAGLALAGKRVVAYGLNPFPATRALDQLRDLLDELKIPVTVAALNVGTCSAEAGYTHMPVESLSILRTFRNVNIITPSDETIAMWAADEVVTGRNPQFIQFDKQIAGQIYTPDDLRSHTGFAVHGGMAELALVTYGIFANRGEQILSLMTQKGIRAKLIDCYSLPLSTQELAMELSSLRGIVCIEDGKADGGLGSLILEILNDTGLTIPVKRLALRFKDGYPSVYCNREMLHQTEALNDSVLIEQVENFYTCLVERQ